MIGTLIYIVLAVCLIWGFKRGIVVQLGSLLAIALALAACHLFGDAATQAATYMLTGSHELPSDPAQSSMTHFAASCIGNLVLFVAVWLVVWLLSRLVKFAAKTIKLGLADSICGSVFMALKGGLIISFIINLAKVVAPESALATYNSTVTEWIADLAPMLLGFFQPLAS